MKVSFNIDLNAKDADSGKGKFLLRLAGAMRDLGHEVVRSSSSADVHILLPCEKMNSKAKINVVRVDGLILNSEQNYKGKNAALLKSIQKGGAVVYQTQFCRIAYESFLKVRKKNAVIHNGANPTGFLPREVGNFFLANCKWRPHKRLKDIVGAYLTALDMGLDADLIVTGDPDFRKDHPRIQYVGWKGIDAIRGYLSNAIATLHLTWLDWCPNSMIESIVAKCPTIYTDSGGQAEIGEDTGIRISDRQWNFQKACKLYSPPSLDLNTVAAAMIEMKKNCMQIDKPCFHIENIAKEYIEYFDKLIGNL
jgi:glycosyltransferase involved in cell wall biosynthesis